MKINYLVFLEAKINKKRMQSLCNEMKYAYRTGGTGAPKIQSPLKMAIFEDVIPCYFLINAVIFDILYMHKNVTALRSFGDRNSSDFGTAQQPRLGATRHTNRNHQPKSTRVSTVKCPLGCETS